MVTLNRDFSETYIEKRSKFITHLFPYKNFQEKMSELKEEHPKGRHFVYAFRYFNEFKQIVEGSSDDGEPKGTSGKPSLAVLKGADIVDVGVIIVRYFGGIKLGTGGLVRAYTSSVNLVLENSELLPYVEKSRNFFEISYSDISKFKYEVSKLHLEIISQNFSELGAIFEVAGEKEILEKLVANKLYYIL
jgi:uncharacterized YigZ family protein